MDQEGELVMGVRLNYLMAGLMIQMSLPQSQLMMLFQVDKVIVYL
jgi:hypothetical protein